MLIGKFITIIPYEYHFYHSIINEISRYDYDDRLIVNRFERSIIKNNYLIENNNIKIIDKNLDLSSLRNINNNSNFKCSKSSRDPNINKTKEIFNRYPFKTNENSSKNLINEIIDSETIKKITISFHRIEENKSRNNQNDIRSFSKHQSNNKILDDFKSKNFLLNKNFEMNSKIVKVKNLLKEKNKRKLRFSIKEMFFINCACLYNKIDQSIEEKIKMIGQVENYLDFFKFIKILRDSVLLKKIILTKDQYNGMRFFYRELDLDNEWIISDEDIFDIIKYKNRGISNQRNYIYDKKILKLISKEISNLL